MEIDKNAVKTELRIKRTNGQEEIIDISKDFKIGIREKMFSKIRKDTKAAGRGEVIEATETRTKSNLSVLIAKYNKINNEGVYGYIPENEYFMALPEYKEWTETKVLD